MMRNSDKKIITSASHRQIGRIAHREAIPEQRGFTKNRQILSDVLDIDTIARLQACIADDADPACCMLCDFLSAFSYIAHQWMFLVFRKMGVPLGLFNLFMVLYNYVEFFSCADGLYVFCFLLLSGVLQGCPLASDMFSFSIEPFIFAIKSSFGTDPRSGIIRACADDLAAAMAR